jgi:hypothetical protein
VTFFARVTVDAGTAVVVEATWPAERFVPVLDPPHAAMRRTNDAPIA